MASINIRPYRPEDWEQVLSVFTRAKPDELKGSGTEADIVPLEEDAGLLKSFQQSLLFVAEQEEQIVGFVGYHDQLLSFLFVDPPAYYRQGIATELLTYVLPLMRGKVWLLVAKTNQAAIDLYHKFDFKVVEEFTGKYNGSILLLVLRLAREALE